MAALRGAPWARDELVAALKLYCITPFGRIHSRNPEVIALSKALGRTPSSIALKMTNFASLDPTIERAGMGNYSKLDELVWNDFFGNMDAYLTEREREQPPIERRALNDVAVEFVPREGIDVLRLTKTRVNQDFFRALVLASYNNKCALTGIDQPDLLVASHIVPWSVDSGARTNPRNGICLNSLHDQAFDEGLITFGDDLTVLYSPQLSDTSKDALVSFSQPKLQLPQRFVPDTEFLKYHRSVIFASRQ